MFCFVIFLPPIFQVFMCSGFASEWSRVAEGPVTSRVYNTQQTELNEPINAAEWRQMTGDSPTPRFYNTQQAQLNEGKDTAFLLRYFRYSEAIEALVDAYKDGEEIADFIGELILLQHHNVERATEWFKKSQSSMGLFYLWLLEKGNRSLHRANLDKKTDAFAVVVRKNFALFENCLTLPPSFERSKQAEFFLKEAISISLVPSTFCRQIYDAYLRLAHYASFPALQELETGNFFGFRNRISIPYDYTVIGYLLVLLHASANQMLLRFISYAFFLKSHLPEFVTSFCHAQAQAYFAIQPQNFGIEPPKKNGFILADKFAHNFFRELIFPQALIAEENFCLILRDKVLSRTGFDIILQEKQQPPFPRNVHIYELQEIARSNFLDCTRQFYYPELRALALIRLGQDQCWQESGNLREAYHYFYEALTFIRENHIDCYFEKWCSVYLFYLAEYFLGDLIRGSEILPIVFVTEIYCKLNDEIKKRLSSMNQLQSTKPYYVDYLKLTALICRDKLVKVAILGQFLGNRKYYKKRTFL